MYRFNLLLFTATQYFISTAVLFYLAHFKKIFSFSFIPYYSKYSVGCCCFPKTDAKESCCPLQSPNAFQAVVLLISITFPLSSNT